jgi:hypothetical protein
MHAFLCLCHSLHRDRDGTLVARREWDFEVSYYRRNPPVVAATAFVPGATPTPRTSTLYPRDLSELEDVAKAAFPDMAFTVL